MSTATCIGPDCGRTATTRHTQLCGAHAKQWARNGRNLDALTPLKNRRAALDGNCTFPDCPNGAHAKDLCQAHYRQQMLGRPLKPLQSTRTGCDFPGCDDPHQARGYCSGHYQQHMAGAELRELQKRLAGTGLPAGWFRKTKPVKTKPARHELDAGAIVVDFHVPALPDELTQRARQRLVAMGADDLLDMLGLEAS